MKIKFNSDNELPLYKMIETPTMTIVTKAIFLGNNNIKILLDIKINIKFSQMKVYINYE